jgi:pSer/pThr/pTyr-binding forkhead associated (FHA) protein
MPALVLNLLKILFLVLIFIFLWQMTLAIRLHIGSGTSARSGRASGELVLLRGDEKRGTVVKLRPGGIVIGRDDDAELTIDDPYASEFHARVGTQDGKVIVHDLGSTNGTYVNGRRVTAPVGVAKGDTIQIGKTILEVR